MQVCSLLRSSETSSRESSSKHFIGAYKTSDNDALDTKSFQRERADLDARERLLAKREQVLLAQAKDISERSRVLAQAENETTELRMKGLVAAEKLGRSHVQEVAAASSKLIMLADDVRGTSDALNALLSGVQALTDVENGNRLSRHINHFEDNMQQLDQHAHDLEIRGNQHAANFMSLESAAVKSFHTSSADWRASPFAASLDDEEAALWDRLTIEQLEVLHGLYHTHSKVRLAYEPQARARCAAFCNPCFYKAQCVITSDRSSTGPQCSHAASSPQQTPRQSQRQRGHRSRHNLPRARAHWRGFTPQRAGPVVHEGYGSGGVFLTHSFESGCRRPQPLARQQSGNCADCLQQFVYSNWWRVHHVFIASSKAAGWDQQR
jgi:hypothetical protein